MVVIFPYSYLLLICITRIIIVFSETQDTMKPQIKNTQLQLFFKEEWKLLHSKDMLKFMENGSHKKSDFCLFLENSHNRFMQRKKSWPIFLVIIVVCKAWSAIHEACQLLTFTFQDNKGIPNLCRYCSRQFNS